MTCWLVTRHRGLLDWIQHARVAYDHHVEHLNVSHIAAGDLVIGSLPVHLAAAVCARGARYLHISLELDRGDRGQELGAEDMNRRGARLEEYVVQRRQACDLPPK